MFKRKNNEGSVSTKLLTLTILTIMCLPVISYVNKEIVPAGQSLIHSINSIGE